MSDQDETTAYLREAAKKIPPCDPDTFCDLLREARDVAWQVREIMAYPAIDIFLEKHTALVLVCALYDTASGIYSPKDIDVLFVTIG